LSLCLSVCTPVHRIYQKVIDILKKMCGTVGLGAGKKSLIFSDANSMFNAIQLSSVGGGLTKRDTSLKLLCSELLMSWSLYFYINLLWVIRFFDGNDWVKKCTDYDVEAAQAGQR